MPKSPSKSKHPSQMTTDEALNRLFHPKIVAHVKDLVAKSFETKEKKPTKGSV
jgi:hypothetical protein